MRIAEIKRPRWTPPEKQTRAFRFVDQSETPPRETEISAEGISGNRRWKFTTPGSVWIVDRDRLIRKSDTDLSWSEVGSVSDDTITFDPQFGIRKKEAAERRRQELSVAPPPQEVGGRIVYARGFPYGAPMAMIRGGATRHPVIKHYLYAAGFRWDDRMHAYVSYEWREGFRRVLRTLRDDYGCEIKSKADMNPGYVIDLDRTPE